MNFAKEPKSRIFFGGGGGGGGGGGRGGSGAARYEHERQPPYFYTRHKVTISSTELYSLMKIFLMVFKIEGTVA